jgi:hypothetical protein
VKAGDLVKYKEEYIQSEAFEDVGIVTRVKDKMPSLGCVVLWTKASRQEFEWVDELEVVNESVGE